MKNKFTFNSTPSLNVRRSRFDLSHKVLTSANVGTLYPFMCREVLPGDSWDIKSNFVSRLSSSFIKPIMDNLFLDMYHFFVPSRLCYDNWSEVFGENKNGAWAPATETLVPMMKNQSVECGTIGDYLGLPVGNISGEISILPFRAFALIYNEWFRDENIIRPTNVITGALQTSVEYLNTGDWSYTNYTGKPPKVAKLHDMFTSALPAPQKGSPVSVSLNYNDGAFIPLATNYNGSTPIFNEFNSGTYKTPYFKFNSTELGDLYAGIGGTVTPSYTGGGSTVMKLAGYQTANIDGEFIDIAGSNLGVNPEDFAENVGISVNDMRLAFQTQKILERAARGGTRYTEYLQSTFNVTNPDSRLQRPEFLGGKRIPLSVQQVAQTSTPADSTGNDALGNVGAYSLSAGRSRAVKGFTEHGYIISVFCIRQFHSYSQGVEKMWRRKKQFDFYDPAFAHLGEQPIYTTELFASANVNDIFGYNEYGVDYRYIPNKITGQMRSPIGGNFQFNSLDAWHLGDDYANAPTLTKGFIEETPIYLDRTIVVDSSEQDQFIVDIWNDIKCIREMPTYSIPGLIDHY